MSNNKFKYCIYARKSTESEDRQVVSLESQVNELKRLAEKENLEIAFVYLESKSAKDPGRPLFNQMIEAIERGEVRGILCWQINRLSRNPIDGGMIQYLLQKGKIINIRTPFQTYKPGDNAVIMSVELGIANQYIRELSDNVKRGIKTKNEQGWKIGPAPIGYLNTKQTKGTNKILVDSERFIIIRKAFDLVLEGQSPAKVWRKTIEEMNLRYANGHKISRTSFYRLLNNPFYYGWFESPVGSGTWYKGQHQPMITKEEFDKVQILLGKYGNTRPKDYSFPYTGLIRCGECGASITAEYKKKEQKNGNTHLYTYYHCTKRIKACSQKTIREEDLEKQIIEILNRIYIPKEFCKWALEKLKQENQKEQYIQEQINQKREDLLKSVTIKLNRLLDLRINDEISEEDFKKKQIELNEERIRLIEQTNASTQHINDWIDKAEFMINFAETAKAKFESGSLETKKAILTLLGSNLILLDGKLSIDVVKPIILLNEIEKITRILPSGLEPAEKQDINRNKGLSYSNSFNLRRGRDSNPRSDL